MGFCSECNTFVTNLVMRIYHMMQEKLPKKQVFGYLMGIVTAILMIGFFTFSSTKFFLHDLEMNRTYWYIGLVIYAFVNAFNDPLIGYMSDTREKIWITR